MAFVIQTRDKPDYGHVRTEWRAQHIAYLDRHRGRLLAAGALIDDDAGGGHGGVIILDTDDREEAEDFIANDPFSRAGLFESVSVTRWRKAFFDGQRLV